MSANKNNSPNPAWSSAQAYSFAVVCLLLGIAAGWLIRGSAPTVNSASAAASTSNAVTSSANTQPTPEQLKKMADVQAAPLLQKLKSDPNNPELLATIGNYYYDAQQYPIAIGYYHQTLKLQPSNTSVRTDMATAFWYAGDADTAITEFKRSLADEPNKANTLFNLGMVEWQGKMDTKAAVAAWQKLLDTNANYADKDKVLGLIAQVRKHEGLTARTSAKPLAQ